MMAVVVKAVNFIHGRAVNHHIFCELCSEIGSEFQALLFHTEVFIERQSNRPFHYSVRGDNEFLGREVAK